MFQIGEFARLSGLSINTLRHYDATGILRPSRVDPHTGYRAYDAAQLSAVNQILALKDAGFSLEEIARTRADVPSTQALVTLLEAKAGDMRALLLRQQEKVDRLLNSIFLIKNGGIPIMNEIRIKSTEPILVCAIRRTIDRMAFDQQLEEMWPAVNAHIAQMGGKTVVPCMMLYYDGTWSHKTDTLDIEVIEPIAGAIEGKGEVIVHTLPAEAEMACIVHVGPFSTIGGTYRALFDWLRQNGYTPKGPLREIYHKGDWATDDPAEYVTELQIPVSR